MTLVVLGAPKVPLPDFFIGAHCQLMGCPLATADTGRKYIVDVYEKFPDESLYFFEELSTVFLNEKTAKKQKFNPNSG